jgi:protein N-terminal amidase
MRILRKRASCVEGQYTLAVPSFAPLTVGQTDSTIGRLGVFPRDDLYRYAAPSHTTLTLTRRGADAEVLSTCHMSFRDRGRVQGYMFPDAPSVAPYLEHPKTGPTASFCAELARRLECHVVAGFPERLEPPTSTPSTSDPRLSRTTSPPTPSTTPSTAPSDSDTHPGLIGANAALLYDTTGHLVHAYHKSNLFPTDLTWARPGPGFTALDLPAPFGRTAVAICNDVNVDVRGEGWVSIARGPYELAEFCEREGVRVLVLLNAWLRPEDGGMEGVECGRGRERDRDVGAGDGGDGEDGEDGEGLEEDGDDGLEPNWRVLNYWATRLRPLWATSKDGEEGTRQSDVNEQRDVIVVVCNRFGHERGAISVS